MYAARDPRTDAFLVDAALRRSAEARSSRVALVCDGSRVTYAELDALANAAARALREAGGTRGDRALIALDNSLACVAAFYGALRADLIPCVVGTGLRAQRLAALMAKAAPRIVVTDDNHAEMIRELFRGVVIADLHAASLAAPALSWPRQAIDLDIATICWTSGSTGEPKGVMLSHQNLMNSTAAISGYLEHQQSDVVLCVLPLSHSYGLFQMLVTFASGGTLVLHKGYALAWPIVETIARERVTAFAGVPTIFASMLALKNLAAADLSSLRYVTSAANALPAEQVRRLMEALPNASFFAMYGQTECTRVAYLPAREAVGRAGSVGISMPNQEAWLVREDGSRATAGEVGELCVRGANVMRGYFADPEATARALRPGVLPGEVVLHTGDLFRLDADGYLHFVARSDDVIKSRGEKVSPAEVEAAIATLASVAEVAVIGVADERLGMAVKAFVVPTADASISVDEVKRCVLTAVGDAAVPKIVEVLAALPRTHNGKIARGELR